VDRNARDPSDHLQNDERILTKLFEMEVPEIYDGTVLIERAVRDPAIAPSCGSFQGSDVDPVGACVG